MKETSRLALLPDRVHFAPLSSHSPRVTAFFVSEGVCAVHVEVSGLAWVQCSQVSLHPDTGCRTGAAQINLSARGSRGADRTHIVLRSWSSAKKTHLLHVDASPALATYCIISPFQRVAHNKSSSHEDPRRPAYVNFTYMHPSSSVICAATSAPSLATEN